MRYTGEAWLAALAFACLLMLSRCYSALEADPPAWQLPYGAELHFFTIGP